MSFAACCLPSHSFFPVRALPFPALQEQPTEAGDSTHTAVRAIIERKIQEERKIRDESHAKKNLNEDEIQRKSRKEEKQAKIVQLKENFTKKIVDICSQAQRNIPFASSTIEKQEDRLGDLHKILEIHTRSKDSEQTVNLISENIALQYVGRAERHYNLKQYAEALSDYDKVIAIRPGLTSNYMSRANCYVNLGQYSKATQDCDRMIMLDQENPASFIFRNRVRKSYIFDEPIIENISTAISQFQEQKKDASFLFVCRAGYYFTEGHEEKGKNDLRAVAKSNSSINMMLLQSYIHYYNRKHSLVRKIFLNSCNSLVEDQAARALFLLDFASKSEKPQKIADAEAALTILKERGNTQEAFAYRYYFAMLQEDWQQAYIVEEEFKALNPNVQNYYIFPPVEDHKYVWMAFHCLINLQKFKLYKSRDQKQKAEQSVAGRLIDHNQLEVQPVMLVATASEKVKEHTTSFSGSKRKIRN